MKHPITVSDTALWAAMHRAREGERLDALFRDPLSRILVGEHAERLASGIGDQAYSWVVPVRTHLLDRMMQQSIAFGTYSVVNLGAGLDTRPYRLPLPRALHWTEVDQPELMAY